MLRHFVYSFTIAVVVSMPAFAQFPSQWGKLRTTSANQCADLSGEYALIGEVISDAPVYSKAPFSLNQMIGASSPGIEYRSDIDRYVVLVVSQGVDARAIVYAGTASKTTDIPYFICENGWWRWDRSQTVRSEGNSTTALSTLALTLTEAGDLVAKYFEESKSSTFFGLLKSASKKEIWVRYLKR